MSTEHQSALNALGDDIWTIILRHVAGPLPPPSACRGPDDLAQDDLARCMRVSSDVNRLAAPILYLCPVVVDSVSFALGLEIMPGGIALSKRMSLNKRECLAYTRRLHLVTLGTLRPHATDSGFNRRSPGDRVLSYDAIINIDLPSFAERGISVGAYNHVYERTHYADHGDLVMAQACSALSKAHSATTRFSCSSSLDSILYFYPDRSSNFGFHINKVDHLSAEYVLRAGRSVLVCNSPIGQINLIESISRFARSYSLTAKFSIHITLVPFVPLPAIQPAEGAIDTSATWLGAGEEVEEEEKDDNEDRLFNGIPSGDIEWWIETVNEHCKRKKSHFKIEMATERRPCPACLDPPTTLRWRGSAATGGGEDGDGVDEQYAADVESKVREMIAYLEEL